jgi:hypothetical protein
MPKKKLKETSAEQAARFRAAVQKLIEAGELDPAEADAKFKEGMEGVARLHKQWVYGEDED